VIRIVNASDEHLELVYRWRNSPEVRKWSYFEDLVSRETHHIWFLQLLQRHKKIGWIILYKDMPIGFIYLQNINEVEKVATSSYYIGEPKFCGRGVGTAMAVATIELAFSRTNLNRLKGEIIACNSAAVKVADAIGWKKLQILEKHLIRHNESHDIIVNSYERQDWELFLKSKSNKVIEQSRKLYLIQSE